jgi:hypothetical protein
MRPLLIGGDRPVSPRDVHLAIRSCRLTSKPVKLKSWPYAISRRIKAKQTAASPLGFVSPFSDAVAPDCGMNLPSVGVEHAHGHGARRPIRVDDEGDRARDAVSVGAPFANDVPRAVQELDSVLHARRFRQPSPVASNRFVDADRACLAAVGEQSAGQRTGGSLAFSQRIAGTGRTRMRRR